MRSKMPRWLLMPSVVSCYGTERARAPFLTFAASSRQANRFSSIFPPTIIATRFDAKPTWPRWHLLQRSLTGSNELAVTERIKAHSFQVIGRQVRTPGSPVHRRRSPFKIRWPLVPPPASAHRPRRARLAEETSWTRPLRQLQACRGHLPPNPTSGRIELCEPRKYP